MRLGDWIGTLEALNPNLRIDAGELHSYRGYYEQLAIEPTGNRTARQALREAQEAVGKTFTGYKGGEYEMNRDTPMWIARWGEASGEILTGIMVRAATVEMIGVYDLAEP